MTYNPVKLQKVLKYTVEIICYSEKQFKLTNLLIGCSRLAFEFKVRESLPLMNMENRIYLVYTASLDRIN